MEEQMRQLYGQVEQLRMDMMQLSEQMQQLRAGSGTAAKPKASTAPGQSELPNALDSGLASGEVLEGGDENDDLYAYQTGELDKKASEENLITGGLQQAPGPQPLGTLPAPAPGTVTIEENAAVDPGQPVVPEPVETASLESQAPVADTPEKLYELSYESLLRKRYGEAEAGFRTFIQKNPEHELAGNAEFWLGETYYVQANYKAAAQAFLTGYQAYPKNRKAPDSLLKLGMSLSELGQKDQACAAFATIDTKFPKAEETRKRAQDESQKAGC